MCIEHNFQSAGSTMKSIISSAPVVLWQWFDSDWFSAGSWRSDLFFYFLCQERSFQVGPQIILHNLRGVLNPNQKEYKSSLRYTVQEHQLAFSVMLKLTVVSNKKQNVELNRNIVFSSSSSCSVSDLLWGRIIPPSGTVCHRSGIYEGEIATGKWVRWKKKSPPTPPPPPGQKRQDGEREGQRQIFDKDTGGLIVGSDLLVNLHCL